MTDQAERRRLVSHQTAGEFTSNFAENVRRVRQGNVEIIVTKYGNPVARFSPMDEGDFEIFKIIEAGSGSLGIGSIIEFISKYRDAAISGGDMNGAEALSYVIDEMRDTFGN